MMQQESATETHLKRWVEGADGRRGAIHFEFGHTCIAVGARRVVDGKLDKLCAHWNDVVVLNALLVASINAR